MIVGGSMSESVVSPVSLSSLEPDRLCSSSEVHVTGDTPGKDSPESESE